MKISEWLNKTFGGKWRFAGMCKWMDSENEGREAVLIGDTLRVTETTELKR